MSKIYNVLICDQDIGWIMETTQELSFYAHIKIIGFAQTGQALIERLKSTQVDAALVGQLPDMTTINASNVLKDMSPETKVFVLSDEAVANAETISKSSIHEIPNKLSETRKANKAGEKMNDISRMVSQRVIMTYNTKGGVGKTTVASNLAVAIQMSELNYPVVLVDFDLGGCNVVTYTHLTDMDAASRNVTMWDHVPEDITEDDLNEILLEGPGGIKIVSSPVNQALADKVTVDLADKILRVLKKHFAIIVIDNAPNISAPVDAALLHSTHVLLICNPEGQSINHVARMMHLLSPDRELPDKPNMSHILKKMFLVVNHAHQPSEWDFKHSEITEALGKPVFATIPYDDVIRKSLHGTQRKTAIEIEPDGSFGLAIKLLADNICGAYPGAEKQKKTSFLKKFAIR